MASSKFKKQTKKQMTFYEDVIERNRDFILNKQGVVGFGIGYKTINGKRTNTICLLVYVDDKKEVARRNRIPKTIEGIPTDVVQAPPLELTDPPEAECASPAPLPSAPVVDRPLETPVQTPVEAPVPDSRYQAPPPSPAPVVDSFAPVPAEQPPKLSEVSQPDTSQFQQTYPNISGPRIPNRKFDPLVGGVPIHNPNTGEDRVGVLGAVVFDKNTDQPMGLSVAHAIGNQVGDKLDQGKKAKRGDPIDQPPASNDIIGTLLDFDADYDAALFEINNSRKVLPKMVGLSGDFDVNEPIKPRVGMKVVCPSRFTYATGVVMAIMSNAVPAKSYGTSKLVETIYIRFDKESKKTRGGDSGSVWLESKSNRPVGLHRGLRGWRFANGDVDSVAFATSMVQLAKWHPFRFSPSKSTLLAPEVAQYETTFVPLKNGLVAFCRPSDGGPLVIKTFDRSLRVTGETVNKVSPKCAIGVAAMGNTIYAAWSGRKKKICWASMSKSETILNQPTELPFATQRKPALISFANRLVMAFRNPTTQMVSIAVSRDGKKWWRTDLSNTKTKYAPALLALSNKVVLCWVARRDNRIVVADLYRVGKSFNVYNRQTLWYYQAAGDPVLATGQGKIFLGYATLKGEMRVLESSDRWSWSIKSTDSRINKSNAALVFLENELISLRSNCHSSAKTT